MKGEGEEDDAVMKTILLVVRKTTTPYIQEGIADYSTRVNRFSPFEIKVIPDIKNAGKLGNERQKEAEGKLILDQVGASDHLILLDERGRQFTSREFATFLQQKSVELPRNLIFAVGGPYGFSKEVYARANGMMSLSKMTFPHELIRIFFVEQLYRAHTIARNMPYHHD